jgi:hypothetical protein
VPGRCSTAARNEAGSRRRRFDAFAVECELALADVDELTGELEQIGI